MKTTKEKGEIARGEGGQWNSLSISRSSHKYCNCVVIEKERLWAAALWLTLSECCLTFLNELNMNTGDKGKKKK